MKTRNGIGLDHVRGGIRARPETTHAAGEAAAGAKEPRPGVSKALAVLAVAGLSAAGAALAQPCATPLDLGTPPGSISSYATAISASGEVVVGYATGPDGRPRAFRWSLAGGLVDLASPDGPQGESIAMSVSFAGSAVVGYARIDGVERAFRWWNSGFTDALCPAVGSGSGAFAVTTDGGTAVGEWRNQQSQIRAFRHASNGFAELGTLGGSSSSARAVSSDGYTVAGSSATSDGRTMAFRWTSTGGMRNLGTLPGDVSSTGEFISADGRTVAGHSVSESGRRRGFIWTEAGGMRDLGEEAQWTTTVHAMSSNGRVLAGRVDAGNDGYAMRWTAERGIQPLTVPWPARDVTPSAISANGSVIVGNAIDQTGTSRALRWTNGRPAETLRSFGDRPARATAISPNGLRIVGYSGVTDEAEHAVLWSGLAADINADGVVDLFDYAAFVECFEAGACETSAADFNLDGFVDFFDFGDFVAAFEGGC